jgi:hypothetical protein
MASFIRSCGISPLTNCWKTKLGNSIYAIMPAHVAIYRTQNEEWMPSQYLKNCGNLEWNITSQWKNTLHIKDDFAWAKLPSILSDEYLSETLLSLSDPIDGNFYFNQPFDMNGRLSKAPTLGKVKGIVYPSPGSTFLESIGIGFRGMSGAVCVDDKNDLIGMFVRRGVDLGTHKSEILIKNGSTLPMRRGIIIPTTEMLKHIEKGGVQIT